MFSHFAYRCFQRKFVSSACLVLLLFCCRIGSAQTVLALGDMAFLSLKVSGGDGFACVTFKNLCPKTVIYFSDNPYRNSGGFCTSREEFCISLTVTTTIPAGTQITYNDGAPGTFTLSAGAGTIAWAFNSEAGQNNGFSSSGDNCFAFQGTYLNPSFICGIKTSAYTASGGVTCSDRAHTERPSSLTLGTSALFVNVGGNDGIYYDCSTTSGTMASLRAAINNSANWTSGASTSTRPCTFTVTDAPADPCSVTCSCNIWAEDFNTTRYPTRATTGANSNTINPAADWTTSATDCDDATPFGTLAQSYWGTDAGIFRCNDIEGPCGACSPGGTTLNSWVTESITIAGYTDVTICVDYANTGTMELNNSASSCNNADDIIQGEYRINGGAWVTWFFDDGNANLAPATISGLNGNTLEIRIYVGNKANDENHTIDNVCVSGTIVPTPVELTEFSAVRVGLSNAVLTWTTSSETNNDYFSIEKTSEGMNWETIGRVQGNGTTSETQHYSFTDENAGNTQFYYRLRQVDYNGDYLYSAVRTIEANADLQIGFYPNPIEDHFVVTGLTLDQTNNIEVYDCVGNLVLSVVSYESQVVLSAAELTSGIYFLRVQSGDLFSEFKLVKTEQ